MLNEWFLISSFLVPFVTTNLEALDSGSKSGKRSHSGVSSSSNLSSKSGVVKVCGTQSRPISVSSTEDDVNGCISLDCDQEDFLPSWPGNFFFFFFLFLHSYFICCRAHCKKNRIF